MNIMSCLMGAVIGVGVMASVALAEWSTTDLGDLGGGESIAKAVNDVGMVVGKSRTVNGNFHAFLWSRGKLLDLGADGDSSYAVALNKRGEVIGNNVKGDTVRAYLWQGNKMVDLGTLGGTKSIAGIINDNGEVVGASTDNNGVWHYFLWKKGQIINLAPMSSQFTPQYNGEDNQPFTAAFGKNGEVLIVQEKDLLLWEKGQIKSFGPPPLWAGFFSGFWRTPLFNGKGDIIASANYGYGMVHTYLLQDGTFQDGTFQDIRDESASCINEGQYPVAMNKSGQLIGHFGSSGPSKAFFWDRGQTVCVDPLPGGTSNRLTDVNDHGEASGVSYWYWFEKATPFHWFKGQLTSLPLPDGATGVTVAINKQGDIIGNVGRRAVLWSK